MGPSSDGDGNPPEGAIVAGGNAKGLQWGRRLMATEI
jgi:hypothetical protein